LGKAGPLPAGEFQRLRFELPSQLSHAGEPIMAEVSSLVLPTFALDIAAAERRGERRAERVRSTARLCGLNMRRPPEKGALNTCG
jgi:hypothetical protein